MAGSRHDAIAELAALEAAYRKSLRTIIGHTVFLVLCCAVAIISRRMFNMPPALLAVVLIVAFALFGGDFLRFLNQRRRLRELRQNLS